MMYRKSGRTTAQRISRLLVAGLLVVGAALGAVLGYPTLTSSSSTIATPSEGPPGAPPRPQLPPRQAVDAAAAPTAIPPTQLPRPHLPPRQAVGEAPIAIPRDQRGAAAGPADGVVPDGTTVFADEIAGIANLDPALLAALRQAATDAAGDDVAFAVTSGWRSADYQNQLLAEAVATYGTAEEAARWVATPATSPHVSGDAIDIGGYDAMAWLAEHGAAYGLCQIYGNEPWHYELRPAAIDRGCPPMYADPTHDPRMQP